MTQTVMVTGASAGVGRSLAHRFASDGFDIVAVARRSELLEELTSEVLDQHGRRVVPLCVDLTEPGAAERAYEEVRGLDIRVLINNAGLGDWNFAWDLSVDRLHEMIDLNIRALTVLSVLFTKDNKDNDAQLINVASAAGYALFAGAVPYSATKFYVTALTEGIQLDIDAAGGRLRAKLLVPGPFDTEFTAISLSETKFPARGTDGVTFHTPDEIAEFAHQLYASEHNVGLVDPTDMTFQLRDSIHPTARLT
ncbi:MAG: SDR family NAD(P)-dependent oxidoreductase [Ilumatobacter sp.]